MLRAEEIRGLLAPYVVAAHDAPGTDAFSSTDWMRLYEQLSVYLELILKWNARTNLTAIRKPEEIVRRHFGESLLVGLAPAVGLRAGMTVLDFGSGGGFPGVPVQILWPDVRVTLAESQGKKAAFLREVVRTLGLPAEVWADRVEAMAAERRFDVVAMRAVDRMEVALGAAAERARERLVVLGTDRSLISVKGKDGLDPVFFGVESTLRVPGLADGAVLVARRLTS